MGRDRPNKFWTSADGNTPQNQLLNTDNITNQFTGGGEVRFGRYFGGPAAGIGGAALGGCGNCCGGYAVEAVYWALTPLSGYASVNAPSPTDGLVTPIILNAPPAPTIGPYYGRGLLRRRAQARAVAARLSAECRDQFLATCRCLCRPSASW